MTRLRFIRSFAICFALLLLGNMSSYAATDLYTTELRGSGLDINNKIVAKDAWYAYMQSSTDWYDYTGGQADYTKRFANVNAIGRVALKYDGSELKMYTTPWELILSYHVKAYGANGTLLEEKDDVLTITYDPGYNIPYVDVAVNEYEGAHHLDIEITHVCGQPNGAIILADDFILEGIIEVERYFILNHNTLLNTDHQLLNNDGSGANTTIEYLWSYTEGAEEYELQYVHVSDQLINSLLPGDIVDFKNATRIITPFQDFRLIPAYETGSIFFRVRALGRHGENFTHPQLGKWSATREIVLGDILGAGIDVLAYEPDHNWMHRVTHVEYGKRTETSVFVDGRGEERQSVIKNNDNDLVIIRENMQDYEGRPAVAIHPSTFLPNGISSTNMEVDAALKFYDNYSLAHNTTTQYNKEFFDKDVNRHNPSGLEAGLVEKAGTYLSAANPLKNYSFNRYLPNAVETGAGSFAYARTLYDDQGRRKEVSEIGPDYKIGSGHTTKYFYGTPSQKKLDQLFGTEIGYAKQYRKTMTQDPNGQLTVSYEKLDGKLIATALVGYAPTQAVGTNELPLVDDVGSGNGILGMLTEDLTTHNEYDQGNQQWEIIYSKLVSTPGPYTFDYDLDLTGAQYSINCGGNTFNQDCEYLLDIKLLDPEGDAVNFSGYFNIVIVDQMGNAVSTINQASFPVEVLYGADYELHFTATFSEIGNYSIVKELRLKGAEDAIANYTSFVNNPSNACVSVSPILSDCNGPTYVTDENWTPADGDDCATLLDILKADLSPGGQYFDNIHLGVADPLTINNWLLGVDGGYNGPNIFAPNNGPVDQNSFNTLETILAGEGITINITNPEEGWNAFRDHWEIQAVQDHLFNTGSGDWGIQQFHPEYGHYDWCIDIDASTNGNANFDLNQLKYENIPPSWIPDLTQMQCPEGSVFYEILNADPYFSSSMGNRKVHGNGSGMTGKELMREIICIYPEATTAMHSMWGMAVAADQNNMGTGDEEDIWKIFVHFYRQQKSKVIKLQKKNPCDSPNYSPFLFDAATSDTPVDLVANLPRVHAFYLWGPSVYGLGNAPNPSSGLHPTFYNWAAGCQVFNSSIPKIQDLNNAWSLSGANEQLHIMDERAEGFQIRIPDLEQGLQDLVDPGDTDGVYGEFDEWQEVIDMMNEVDPCAQGAAAMIPYGLELFPASGATIAAGLARILYYEDETASPAECVQISDDPMPVCTALVVNGTYYSYQDFYYDNQEFFDCLVATVNDRISAPWNFMATHTPTHLVISSPDHYLNIPDGTEITTFNTCNCNPKATSNNGNSFQDNSTAKEDEKDSALNRSAQGIQTINGCYPFINPCNQLIPHCLCEDLAVVTTLANQNPNKDIADYYSEEYGSSAFSWGNFINALAFRCNAVINNPTATEDAIELAIAQIEDIADGQVTLPSSPNAPAPVALGCFDLEPDPCEEGQMIADYYTEQAHQEEIDQLIADFTANYSAFCLSPTDAPDSLKMKYEDREYHFTLYYYSPDGNLHATVPPQGVHPIPDLDPDNDGGIFDQIRSIRDNGWGGGYVVPDHRRNMYRDDQMMTIYKHNSYNSVIKTKNPDHKGIGDEDDDFPTYGETEYLYDDLGRLRFSKTPEQDATSRISYTKYDEQSRVKESGELEWTSAFVLLQPHLNNQEFPQAATYILEERLVNFYDEVSGTNRGGQENLRQRMVKMEYYETEAVLSHATHYNYDVRGNVKTIWQEDNNVINPNGFIKRIDYKFGAVDGLVYQMDYQKGMPDAYSHKYCYDANNRLVLTRTSDGGGIWDRDERNFYRFDMVTARRELGTYKVQGIDYAYTLQGWIKGVNSSTILTSRDIGNDGALSSTDSYNKLHRWSGRDAYGYSVNYHANDYSSINSFNATDHFYTQTPASNGLYFDAFDGGNVAGLYNGNITTMQTALTGQFGVKMDYLLKGYRYDQLMRVKGAFSAAEPAIDAPGNQVYSSNFWDSDNDATEDYQLDVDYDNNGNISYLKRNAYQTSGQNNLMDNMTYFYSENQIGLVNNKLEYVTDVVSESKYSIDVDGQGIDNYSYDRNGNLVSSPADEITTVEWNVNGKVKKITRPVGSSKPDIEFRYDGSDYRIEKITKPKAGAGTLLPEEYWSSTLYVRDHNGNVLATYDKDYDRPIVDGSGIVPDLTQYGNDVYIIRAGSGVNPPADSNGVPELGLTGGFVPAGSTGNEFLELITWKESHLFGSGRLGIEKKEQLVDIVQFNASQHGTTGELNHISNLDQFNIFEIDQSLSRAVGSKYYELTNYLGNVLEIVSDKLIPVSTNGTDVAYFEADIVSANDYYPFGMTMPGRSFDSPAYGYGFNGTEKEDNGEWADNAHYDYGFRIYNPGLGRFLSIDPLTSDYPELTPYQFASNRPIMGIDLDGLEYYNATSRVGVSGTLTRGWDRFIYINRQYYPNTRTMLTVIRNDARGWSDGRLFDSDLHDLQLKHNNAWDNVKGKGRITNHNHRFPKGNVLILLADYINAKAKEFIVEDMRTNLAHYKNLDKSIKIVENARDMNLIPDEITNLELINYIQDTQLPENRSYEFKKDLKALGTWLFENRETLLQDKLPSTDSGDIRDTGYPLKKFDVEKSSDSGSGSSSNSGAGSGSNSNTGKKKETGNNGA